MHSFRRPRHALTLLAFAAVGSVAVFAHAALSKVGPSSVTALASGPAGMKIEAKTSELRIEDDGTTVKIIVPLQNLKTGMDLRDKHLKDYLEVDKHPNAELTLARSAITFPPADGSHSGQANGKMTLHGVTRDAVFAYNAKRTGEAYIVAGSVKVRLPDYKIEVPSYLGVTVKPEVDVAVRFGATDR